MKEDEVPQDDGLNMGMKEVAYALDSQGQYVKVPSLGWEPKNIANEKAWDEIDQEIEEDIQLIKQGRKSPLVYYMKAHLMDVGLLASYMRMSRWRVKRHMKPRVFYKLKSEILERYAQLFEITVWELKCPQAIYGDQPNKGM